MPDTNLHPAIESRAQVAAPPALRRQPPEDARLQRRANAAGGAERDRMGESELRGELLLFTEPAKAQQAAKDAMADAMNIIMDNADRDARASR